MTTDPADRAREDIQRRWDSCPCGSCGTRGPETPAGRPPATPSSGADDSGVSVDAGTVAERAAQVIDAEMRSPYWVAGKDLAVALADAGLLADPDEVRRLREEVAAARDCAETQRRLRQDTKAWAASKALDLTAERDRARRVAAALEAECARLSEALEDLRVSRPPGRRQYIIDRALSGEEQR